MVLLDGLENDVLVFSQGWRGAREEPTALLDGHEEDVLVLAWVAGNADSLNAITYQITRIVIGIQVLFTGIALPKAYLRQEWLSLLTLLGPIMICAWFVTSSLIWGLIPGLSFLESLIIGACVTPTDPVLANSICKGAPISPSRLACADYERILELIPPRSIR
jgi:hypothetical protein